MSPKSKSQPQRSFSSLHTPAAQHLANTTREATDLYRDGEMPRFVLSGWPCRGTKMGTFTPQFGAKP